MGFDCFTKWPEAYAIPTQEALILAEALVTNFCRFGVLQELRSDQGRNLESALIQEVLQCLGLSKMSTTSLYPQLDCMVEHYIRTVEKHLQKIVVIH
jgi:hypothetical protein